MNELAEAIEALDDKIVLGCEGPEDFRCGAYVVLTDEQAATIQQLILDMHEAHAKTEARMNVLQLPAVPR